MAVSAGACSPGNQPSFMHCKNDFFDELQIKQRILQYVLQYVTMDNNTSHTGQFFEIEIYTSYLFKLNK